MNISIPNIVEFDLGFSASIGDSVDAVGRLSTGLYAGPHLYIRFNRITSPSLISGRRESKRKIITNLHLKLLLSRTLFTFALTHVGRRQDGNKCRHRSIYGERRRTVVHDASVVIRCRKHRNMCRKLLEIEPRRFFNVVPVYF